MAELKLAWLASPLSFLALGVALLLLYRCRKLEPRSLAWMGVLVAVLGIGLAVGVWLEQASLHAESVGRPPELKPDAGRQAVLGAWPAGPSPVLPLDRPDLPISERMSRSGETGLWLVLDASRGIRPEYLKEIENIFGSLEATISDSKTKAKDPAPAPSCWRRTELFPYASGRCLDRRILGSLAPSAHDLARDSAGRGVVSLRRRGLGTLILSFQELERARPSSEETCLAAMADGVGCAAIELLPGPTLGSLAIQPRDQAQARALQEFGIPQATEVDDALAIYETEPTLQLEQASQEKLGCGGFLGSGTLRAIRLERAEKLLQSARGEGDFGAILRELERNLSCPALAILELPALQLRRERAELRSLLTQVREQPLWITTPKSVRSRLRKVEAAGIGWENTQSTLWVKPQTRIERLAVTFLIHHPVADAELGRIVLSDPSVSLDVHRLSPMAFRLSFSAVGGAIGVKLPQSVIRGPARAASTLLDWSGLAAAALVGFMLAGLTVLLQSLVAVPSRQLVFYPGTFAGIFLMSFVWVFLSYRAALAPSGTQISEAGIERPPAPRHLFLREWPAAWLGAPELAQLSKSPKAAKAKDLWAKWTTFLSEAQREAVARLNLRAGRVDSLQVARLPREVVPGGGRVIVWDEPRARNWHFQKSPEYKSWVAGWDTLLHRRKDVAEVATDQSLEGVLGRGPDVLILPDARFLDAADHTRLLAWVKDGGTLVVSDGPVAGASSSRATWLLPAGFGRSEPRSFSLAYLPGARTLELALPHRIVPSGGREQRNSWYGSTQIGSGRAFYLGLPPLDQSSMEVIGAWLGGVLGEKLAVASGMERPCTTSVLLQPWGAPPERIRGFAQTLRSRGVRFEWLIDPESFARMVPTWEEEFTRDGVVFLDDGSRKSRELAEVLRGFLRRGSNEELVFLRSRDRERGVPAASQPGPDGAALLAFASFPGPDGFEIALRDWRSECLFAATDPRLIEPSWIATHPGVEAILGSLKLPATAWVSAAETAKMFRYLERTPAGSRGTQIEPDRLRPLEPREQAKEQRGSP